MIARYRPDFLAMIRLCETNFVQLRYLMPQIDKINESIGYRVNDTHYRLTIIESTRYTTLVEIVQTAPLNNHWSLPFMRARLYYDAKVAEVCSSRQISHFKASYDYPNKRLNQRDEKYQINQFLADWLNYCLAYGAVTIPIC